MFKKWLCVAALATVGLLMTPGISSAQRRGGNGGRGGSGGYNNGYNRGGWGNSGFGLYLGSPYYGSGYGYGSPYYGNSYRYEPSYNYVQPTSPSYYFSPPATTEAPEAAPSNPNIAAMQVRVPANAEIWFDGDRTSQSGAVRHFESPALQPDKTFTYTIRARWTDGAGKVVDRTKQIKVQAGARVGVDFNNP